MSFLDKLAALRRGVALQLHQADAVRAIAETGSKILHHGTGTGKTLSVIAAAEKLRDEHGAKGNVLVLVPAALKSNFQVNGLEKFLKPKDRKRYHVHSYEFFRRHKDELLKRIKPDVLVADEIHRAKNIGGKTYSSVQSAASYAKHRILATASLVSNHPSDVVPLLNMVRGKQDMSAADFTSKFVHKAGNPVAAAFGVKTKETFRLRNKGELRELLSKHIHRFDASPESLKHFPKVHSHEVRVGMSGHQKRLYNFAMNRISPWARFLVERNLPPGKGQAKSFFAQLSQAREISNSPHTLDRRHSVETAAEHSPKFHALLKRVHTHLAKDPKHKAVLYTNLVRSGTSPLSAHFRRNRIRHGVFAGNIPKDERDKAIKDYNANKSRVLIVSPAGVEGLDLKGTTQFHMVDPHWNPEKMRQAVGRAARYKSHEHLPPDKRHVHVYRYQSVYRNIPFLRGRTTVDTYIRNRAKEKQELNDALLKQVKHAQERSMPIVAQGSEARQDPVPTPDIRKLRKTAEPNAHDKTVLERIKNTLRLSHGAAKALAPAAAIIGGAGLTGVALGRRKLRDDKGKEHHIGAGKRFARGAGTALAGIAAALSLKSAIGAGIKKHHGEAAVRLVGAGSAFRPFAGTLREEFSGRKTAAVICAAMHKAAHSLWLEKGGK